MKLFFLVAAAASHPLNSENILLTNQEKLDQMMVLPRLAENYERLNQIIAEQKLDADIDPTESFASIKDSNDAASAEKEYMDDAPKDVLNESGLAFEPVKAKKECSKDSLFCHMWIFKLEIY